MPKFKKYILQNYSALFFQLFFILFSITSIIFLVKIAAQTSILKITFLDLTILYLLQLPNIIYFTVPISFFSAATISLVKLSLDSELIVFFALGISPMKIIKIYFKSALLVSTTLLVIILAVFPITDQLNDRFIALKTKEANLNVKSTEFGQKFGSWLLFVNKSEDNVYKDVVLFSKNTNNAESFTMANEATIYKKNNVFKMELREGKSDLIDHDTIHNIDFNVMILNNLYNHLDRKYMSIYHFWTNHYNQSWVDRTFVSGILISLFPIFSLFLVAAIGIINPRTTRNYTNIIILFSVILYFSISMSIVTLPLIYNMLLFPLTWLISTYLIYRFRTQKRY